jgi:hypothetical protein
MKMAAAAASIVAAAAAEVPVTAIGPPAPDPPFSSSFAQERSYSPAFLAGRMRPPLAELYCSAWQSCARGETRETEIGEWGEFVSLWSGELGGIGVGVSRIYTE